MGNSLSRPMIPGGPGGLTSTVQEKRQSRPDGQSPVKGPRFTNEICRSGLASDHLPSCLEGNIFV